jgi:hypothetical protein
MLLLVQRRRPLPSFVACVGLATCVATASGCHRQQAETSAFEPKAAPSTPLCDHPPHTLDRAPGIEEDFLNAQYWLQKLGPKRAHRILLSARDVARQNEIAYELVDGVVNPADISNDAMTHARIDAKVRIESFVKELHAGVFVEGQPGELEAARVIMAQARQVDEIALAHRSSRLECLPLQAGIYKIPKDPAFDRNRCSMVDANAMVRIIARTNDDRWCHVISDHASGWSRCADFTPALTPQALAFWRSQPNAKVLRDHTVARRPSDGSLLAELRLGADAPWLETQPDGVQILVATPRGPEVAIVRETAAIANEPLSLTRADLFERAFSLLNQPYAWGGSAQGRDCSRYLLDLFAPYGLLLPRHSSIQAKAGLATVDLSGLGEHRKRELIHEWSLEHVVVLFMPGHIMLYLGRARDPISGIQDDYTISAISEITLDCPNEDPIIKLDRVTVTGLNTGRNTEKGAFIERLTTLAAF